MTIDKKQPVRALVQRIVDETGMTLSAIARKGGLSPSTLTRFMNSTDVTHVLSTTTLAKLNALLPSRPPQKGSDLPDLGRRMRLVRQVMAEHVEDAVVARTFGWTVPQMHAIFRGDEVPSLISLREFARRLSVTTDFLLSESLEGLPRSSERALIAADPNLGSPRGDMDLGKDMAQL